MLLNFNFVSSFNQVDISRNKNTLFLSVIKGYKYRTNSFKSYVALLFSCNKIMKARMRCFLLQKQHADKGKKEKKRKSIQNIVNTSVKISQMRDTLC